MNSMENNRHIRMSFRVVFREDMEWMARLMGVQPDRVRMIVDGALVATDADIMLCEMACCEQQKYVKRRIDMLRLNMAN